MTTTDAIADAVAAELERRRLWLDSLEGLRSVAIILKLNPATQAIRTIILQQECETNGRA